MFHDYTVALQCPPYRLDTQLNRQCIRSTGAPFYRRPIYISFAYSAESIGTSAKFADSSLIVSRLTKTYEARVAGIINFYKFKKFYLIFFFMQKQAWIYYPPPPQYLEKRVAAALKKSLL